ncbi:MAG: dockerin type I repeat-containing protein, partial [Clostridia bacterium]|nr:dockerin type I repeat-containing protein [Clostridia bacterium]
VVYKKGDVNADDCVDNLDAAMILKYDAGIIELTTDQSVVADVNGDGYVDNLDAAKILKYDAGIIDSL